MAVVCLDTNILIWGISRQASNESQKDNIQKSITLIENLEKNQDEIIIPSLVWAEFMNGIYDKTPELFDDYDEMLNKYTIASFDKVAAIIYSRLRRKATEEAEIERHKRNIDIMILCTAISRECDALYTDDKKLTNIAKRCSSIEVIGLE